MQLTLISCGEEIAILDADPAWQLQDVVRTLAERFPTLGHVARVLFGTEELGGQSTLSDHSAEQVAARTHCFR